MHTSFKAGEDVALSQVYSETQRQKSKAEKFGKSEFWPQTLCTHRVTVKGGVATEEISVLKQNNSCFVNGQEEKYFEDIKGISSTPRITVQKDKFLFEKVSESPA